MKNSILSWLLAGALIASVGAHLVRGDAQACSPTPEALGLDPGQLASLTSCCSSVCEVDADLRTRIEEVTRAIADELATGTPDVARVRALGERLAGLQAEKVRNCIESVLLVRDVLTAEQLERLRTCCSPNGE